MQKIRRKCLHILSHCLLASSRFLIYLSIILFFLVGHGAVLFLAEGSIALAPDEANYVKSFVEIFNGELLGQRPGWPEHSLTVAKVFLFPAYSFYKISNDPVLAMRLNSILFIVLAFLFLLIRLKSQKKFTRELRVVCLVFFSPALMVFTSLGLRESIVFFLITSLFLLIESTLKPKGRILSFLLLIFVIYSLLVIKFYILLVFFLAYLSSFFLLLFRSKKFPQKKYIYILLTFVVGISLSPQTLSHATESTEYLRGRLLFQPKIEKPQSKIEKPQSKIEKPSLTEGPLIAEPRSQFGTTVQIITEEGKNSSRLSEILNFSQPLQHFIESLGLSRASDGLLTKVSLRDPPSLIVGILNFLFAPFPFFLYKSLALQIISLEFFWLIPIYVMTYRHLRYRRHEYFDDESRFLLSFCIMSALFFVGVSIFVEDYAGILVRHRGVFLIVLASMCAITSRHKKT